MNNGKICVSVCAETADEVIELIKRAEEFADVIEVRFDCLRKEELKFLLRPRPGSRPSNAIIEATTKPIISTFRPKEQGGFRELNEKERSYFWNSGYETEYCDVEEEFVDDSWSWLWRYCICSFHDFGGVPDDIEVIFDKLAQTDADIIKIAIRSDDITDAIPVWKLIDYAKTYRQISRPKVIPIAMGEAGKWMRILGLAHGAYLTYASLETGGETAPGQITARDLNEVYRVKELNRDTAVYGVIGDPLSNSKSPYMHNPAFVSAGLNAVFIPLEVRNLDDFMRRMVLAATRKVELNFAGFAVTMPHKQAIMKYLDVIDPVAEKIGAVNTVKIEGVKLTGYNTDAHGFIAPLRERFGDLCGSRVAVCGAGGAARSCIYALLEEGAEVSLFARDGRKAADVGKEYGVRTDTILNLKSEISNLRSESSDSKVKGFDILVDTTPLGMKGAFENESLFTAEELSGVKFVYDLVTSATDTPIIREAKRAGVQAIGGLEMLLAQGARQFEIWTGKTAPVEIMRAAVQERMK